jgi:hypothetical protein
MFGGFLNFCPGTRFIEFAFDSELHPLPSKANVRQLACPAADDRFCVRLEPVIGQQIREANVDDFFSMSSNCRHG